ncbi:AAA family ATPase [Dyadobacter sp. 676]|uniref:AAA family ATPase n=1 Tax=Dyadobacter sp. 676 TaxID=3088362 RepID=A0AAU8FRK5_9BACT
MEAILSEQKELTQPALSGMLRVRSANQVLKESSETPDPKQYYPHMIVEGEITILFADTGIGKSVIAVQIGDYIARQGVPLLYVDLELSDKQFEKRYRDDGGRLYRFPDCFYRADFTPSFEYPKGVSYEDYFIKSLREAITACGAKVVIIDNMTKLSAADTDTAKATIPIMNEVTKLKHEGLTFLAIEHNKKS